MWFFFGVTQSIRLSISVLNVWIASYAYVFFVVNYACAFRRFEHFNSIYEIVMKNLEISTSHRDFFALFAIKEKQSTTISEHRTIFGCFSFIISLQREWNWIHFAWWMSTHSLWNISSSLFFFRRWCLVLCANNTPATKE